MSTYVYIRFKYIYYNVQCEGFLNGAIAKVIKQKQKYLQQKYYYNESNNQYNKNLTDLFNLQFIQE